MDGGPQITCPFVTKSFDLISKVLTTNILPPEEAKTGNVIMREITRLTTRVHQGGLGDTSGIKSHAALMPYKQLKIAKRFARNISTVLGHSLHPSDLEAEGSKVVSNLQAAKSLVKYIRKSSMAALL